MQDACLWRLSQDLVGVFFLQEFEVYCKSPLPLVL